MSKQFDPAKDVHFIPRPEKVVTAGIKAMVTGHASEHQQKKVINWLVNIAAGTYEQTWRLDRDGGARSSDFAAGRRAVGLAIVREINITDKQSPIAPPTKGELNNG